MADMLDYIRWRGDLPFTVSPPNEVDAVIFSTLSYIPFRRIIWSLLTVVLSGQIIGLIQPKEQGD